MSHICDQVLHAAPQEAIEIVSRMISELEQTTKLATTVAHKIARKLEVLDREINTLQTQAASLKISNQGKAKKCSKKASIVMVQREKMAAIKEHVDEETSRLVAKQNEDVVGAVILGRGSVRNGKLCCASEEDADVLRVLIDRRFSNPDFDVGTVYKWLMSLPKELRE